MQSVLNSKILSPKALINFVFKLSAELNIQTAVIKYVHTGGLLNSELRSLAL